jgi:hypothetical protein
MKKLLTVFTIFIVCVSANAAILNLGFETSEGYPAVEGDSGDIGLTENGWYCNTLGAWVVPYLEDSTFGYMSQRSAKCTAMKLSPHWASYEAAFTPSAGQTTVVYSAAVAIQKYDYASSYTNTTYVYSGIGLVGVKADLTEVEFGGLRIWGNGDVSYWGTTSASKASHYAFNINTWYQLTMVADFAADTVQFYLDGNYVDTLAFSSSIVGLKSISLHNGSTNSWSIGEARYDAISVNVPEPMTLTIFAAGMFFLSRKRRK